MYEQNDASVLRRILWYVLWLIVIAAIVWVAIWLIFFRQTDTKKAISADKSTQTSQSSGSSSSSASKDSSSQTNKNTTPDSSSSPSSNGESSTNSVGSISNSANTDTPAPSELANTGPGNVLIPAGIAAGLGSAAYYMQLRKRVRASN